MATQWQRFEVELPEGYTRTERAAIAQEIIDFIVKRTQDGKDWRGKALPGYSDAYKNSLNFKNAWKSPGDVNFTQSGDTLASLELLESKPGKLVIGWENGSLANAIADGNIRGTYGHSKPVGPKREILGITESDLNKVLSQFPLDQPDKLQQEIDTFLASKEMSRGG